MVPLLCAGHGGGHAGQGVQNGTAWALDGPQLRGRQTHKPQMTAVGPTEGCGFIVSGKMGKASERG